MSIELVDQKQNLVIKRDGREEPYSEQKLIQVLMWASDDNVAIVNSILEAIEIRIYNKIHITSLYDEVMDTVYNMITTITPQYEKVLRKLYVMKMYKELWGIKRNSYPHLSDYLDVFIENGTIIDVYEYFTSKEIDTLSEAIVPSRDLKSSYLGLTSFFDKYSLRDKGKPKELLQHGFMRMAIQAYLYDTSDSRIKKIINRYNNLSLGNYTEATPKFKNSLRREFAGASCCVHKMADNSESINKVNSDIGLYSRSDGGNGVDVSDIRCKYSPISTKGKSSGVVPVIRDTQAKIELYNQSSTRPGACIIYINWHHADIFDVLPLLDEGGKETKRARNLKYGLKINRLFLKAIPNNDDVYLFDPKIAPELNHTYGEEYERLYWKAVKEERYHTKVPAQTLAYEFAKQRGETGNWYVFFTENSNENTPFKEMIYSSNLCTEIFLPTRPTNLGKYSLTQDLSTTEIISTQQDSVGLTALCNLSSINVLNWMSMTPSQQKALADELLEASDNLIDYQYYPTADGEVFNRMYRAIGIGMNNLAHYFASKGIKYSSPEALTEMEIISKSINSVFRQASEDLAKARGNFPWFDKTKHTRPTRFATLFAIAPTSTSSLIIDATEGIEPVSKLLTEKTGTFSAKQLVPNLHTLRSSYELASEIPTKALYDLAAIRQKYLLDQGQSINTYTKDATSAYEIINDIIYAESIGLKSLYYLQGSTAMESVCEGCAS